MSEQIRTDNSAVIERLERERDELWAHCERLRAGLSQLITYTKSCEEMLNAAIAGQVKNAAALLDETPAQSLREIQAEAIEEAVRAKCPTPSVPDDPPPGMQDFCEALADLREYADRIRRGEDER